MAVFNLGFVVFDIICGGKVNPNFRAAARAGAGKVKKTKQEPIPSGGESREPAVVTVDWLVATSCVQKPSKAVAPKPYSIAGVQSSTIS